MSPHPATQQTALALALTLAGFDAAEVLPKRDARALAAACRALAALTQGEGIAYPAQQIAADAAAALETLATRFRTAAQQLESRRKS